MKRLIGLREIGGGLLVAAIALPLGSVFGWPLGLAALGVSGIAMLGAWAFLHRPIKVGEIVMAQIVGIVTLQLVQVEEIRWSGSDRVANVLVLHPGSHPLQGAFQPYAIDVRYEGLSRLTLKERLRMWLMEERSRP